MLILKRCFVVAVIAFTVSVAFAQDQRSRAVASRPDPVPLRNWDVVTAAARPVPQNGMIDGAPAALATPQLQAEALPSLTGGFIGIVPCRVVDTRNANGTFGGPKLVGGASPGRSFPIPIGPCPGIPATASAYSFNITVFAPEAPGFMTAFPTSGTAPIVSNLNYNAGETIPNAAIVPAGTAGAISIFTSANAHVIIDVNGYFTDVGPTKLITYGGETNGVPSTTPALFRTLGTFTKNNASTAVTATWESHIRTVATAANTFCQFQLRIDDTVPTGHTTSATGAVLYAQTTAGSDAFATFMGRWTALSVGTHTVSLWLRGNASNCNDNNVNFTRYVYVQEE